MSLKFAVRSAFAAALVGLAFMATSPARAGEVGMLVCRSPQPLGFIVVSARAYSCTFTPTAGRRQYYRATIYRFGAQAGISSNVTLAWAVFAATRHVGAGALAGGYGGASAGAAVVLGARANALFGGAPSAFALQAVSVEGMTGLNAAATVTGLSLQQVIHRRRHHRR
ncbi:MAG: DUF992 domain-containing protein [Pseudolabrys sp.]|jgi:hypothetical protein